MIRKTLALLTAGVLLTGCYHITVVSGPQPPAPATLLEVPFSHSFVYGLVPPAEINTRERCPAGVAKVETKHSFVNGLVSLLTWSLYTPVHVTVTCAR